MNKDLEDAADFIEKTLKKIPIYGTFGSFIELVEKLRKLSKKIDSKE